MTPPPDATASTRARSAFVEIFGSTPVVLSRAPGRVNLIGEHTDYNDGFVLPMALPFDTVIAARPRTDRRVEAHSEGYGTSRFSLDDNPMSTVGWGRYLHGMAAMLAEHGISSTGFDCCVATDIPTGASLSTSAALEMATGLLMTELSGAQIDRSELALLGQRVENEIFDLPTGIMDQLASAAAIDDHASLIDCRDLTITAVPMPSNASIIVMDTGTRRQLVESEYADRQATCRAASDRLGVRALRDADMTAVDLLADDPKMVRRVRHVIGENQRTLDAAEAMGNNDAEWLGQLMSASHVSLSRDFEVSSPALDAIVALAQELPGCLGARMTGGGFAGCTVALVLDSEVDNFVAAVLDRFVSPHAQPASHPTRLYVVKPSPGASVSAL
jgi:galactokinase